MGIGKATGIVVALAAMPVAAAERPKAPLLPPGHWIVNYDVDACTAGRTFGEGEGQFMLVLRPYISGERIGIDIVDFQPAAGPPTTRDATITISPSGKTWSTKSESFLSTGHRHVLRMDFDRAILADLSTATSFSVKEAEDEKVIPFPMAAALLGAVHKCETELLRQWNIDPDRYYSTARPVIVGSGASLFNEDAYPTEAFRARQQGTVLALLSVSAQGKVTNCKVVVSANSPSLDQRTCEIALKARYTPGTGSDGKPVDGTALFRVRWTMPLG